MNHPFTDEELTEIIEVARHAITDIDFWEYCMAEMDLSKEYADALKKKILSFTEANHAES